MEEQSSSNPNPDKETTEEAESQFSTRRVVDNFVDGTNANGKVKLHNPNPVIMKVDGEIAKLRTEAAEITAKLITLEAQRAAYHIIASNTNTGTGTGTNILFSSK